MTDLFVLPEEHQAIREAVRAVAEDKIAPYAADVDEQARFPQEAADALLASDFHAPHVPEEYGGAGADALATVLVIEEVARVCVSSSLIPAVNKLGSLPAQIGGSEELKKHYLGALARSKGITAFVVEKSDEGVSFGAPEKKLGIKGSPTREVYLDQVRIPEDRVIGQVGEGFSIAMRTLDHTRVTIAAQAVGVAQGALDYALGYVQERKQFGKAIAEFQGIEFMLADMGMKIEAARQLTYAAAGRSERGDQDLTFFGAAAKAFASDVAMQVTTDAVQLLGGYGFTRDYPVERMMRDAKITQIYEGTNQVQRIVMARQLLAGVQSTL